MKKIIFNYIVLLLPLVSVLSSVAQNGNNKNDSIVILKCHDGELQLTDQRVGDLYLYANDEEGFKSTYYLFTSKPYIHLDASPKTNNNKKEYVMIYKSNGRWENIPERKNDNQNTPYIMDNITQNQRVKWDRKKLQMLFWVNAEGKRTEQTVRLLVLPELEKGGFKFFVKHNNTEQSLEEFYKRRLDKKTKEQFEDYKLIIERPNCVVVDSIVRDAFHYEKSKDTPLGVGKWEILLDSIVTSNKAKEISFTIYYRQFGKNGKIEKKDIPLTINVDGESNHRFNGLYLLAIPAAVIFAIIAGGVSILMKKHSRPPKKARQKADVLETAKEELPTKEKEPDWQRESEKLQEENQRLSKYLQEARLTLERAEDTSTELRNKEIAKLQQQFEGQKREIIKQLNETKHRLEEIQQEATDSKEYYDKFISDLKKKQEYRIKSELDKILRLAERLKELIKLIPDDALRGTGGILKAGADGYCDDITKIIAKCGDNLEDGLDLIRQHSLSQLRLGSSSWMHSLGRMYSYLSVELLRNHLEGEGVGVEMMADSFRTFTAMLAAQGIIVLNCSPGYDSNQDPMTRMLFKLDTQVDRITRWLGGGENVRQAIPNHGNTIFDFGTLAYFTCDNTEIQQGSVVYYDE